MKIAMFIRNERMANPNSDAMRALIFYVENEIITGMEDAYLYNMNANYISLWLISRRIEVFYVRNIKDEDRCFFKKIGITVKTFEEIGSNHIFRAFIK